jgi:multiple sugar transport system permease protein
MSAVAGPSRRALSATAARVAAWAVGIVLLIWTLLPVYNMALIALSDDGDEFTGQIWPEDWNWDSFTVIWTEGHWYLTHFWHQFGNSLILGFSTFLATVAIGSLASFSLGRMKRGMWLGDAALLTYVLPSGLLMIPLVHLMRVYGLSDSLWGVAAVEVTFAAPYAILILHQYGKLIPSELDDAAKIDGATPWQIYCRIYVPLMTPALVAVGLYAFLLSWNEYLYQFMLLTSTRNMTVAAAIDQFFDSDEAPWNYMMAVALVYSLPPVAIYFALRRFLISGLGRLPAVR